MNTPVAMRTPRLPLLTVARYPAALVVFLFHLTLPQLALLDPDNISFAYLRWLIDPAGGLGVSFFFILSGFVISWSHRPCDRALSFWRRRFVKILPLYWLSGLAAVAVNPDRLGLLPGYLVMSEAWFDHPAIALGLNAPGWSLCVEAFFYALFPLAVVPLLSRCTTLKRTAVLGAASLAAVIAIVAIASTIRTGVAMPLDASVTSGSYWVAYISPVFRLPEFLIGGCLAIIVRNGWLARVPVWPAGICLAVAYSACLYSPTLWSHRAILILPSAWLILAIAQSNARTTDARAPRWSMKLGEISFAFYLFHYPVLEAATKLAWHVGLEPGVSTLGGVGLISLTASTGLAWALFALIEQPLVRAFGSRKEFRAAGDSDHMNERNRKKNTASSPTGTNEFEPNRPSADPVPFPEQSKR